MAKGENTKQLIIEQSAPIFNMKGIFGTSMSDIMQATKLSKGSLYVHFEDKDSLAFSALEYSLKLQNKKLSSKLDPIENAYEKLMAYLEIYSDPMNPTVPGGCPMLNFGMEADDNFPLVKERVNMAVEMRQRSIEEMIKTGIKDGIFKPDWNYQEFATIMFALIEGGIMICRIAGNNSKMTIVSAQLKKMIQDQLINNTTYKSI